MADSGYKAPQIDSASAPAATSVMQELKDIGVYNDRREDNSGPRRSNARPKHYTSKDEKYLRQTGMLD